MIYSNMKYRKYVNQKLPGTLGNGETQLTLANVKSAAQAHIDALDKAKTGERYLLGDEIITINRNIFFIFLLFLMVMTENVAIRNVYLFVIH